MSDEIFQVRKVTDYARCCCCQDKTKVNLRTPYNRQQDHEAYNSLEKDLKDLVDNGIVLPWGLNLTCIDNGDGIAKTLLDSKAIYHAKCRTKIRKLIKPIRDRAEEEQNKNNNNDEDTHCSPAKT